jgi:shikimate kinase
LNPEPLNSLNLFLIGYRCTGKTTVGKILADELKCSFVDTDALVVAQQQMSIREIVDAHGWEGFRGIEHVILKEVSASAGQIVATGGGIVLSEKNVRLMRKSGNIVWLRAKLETIKARMLQDTDTQDFRPALTLHDSISEIEETLQSREPLYKRAMDFYVDTDEHDIRAVTESIMEKIRLEYPKVLKF